MKTLQEKKIEKLEEYIKYLLKAIKSESIIRDITDGARSKFESELAALDKEIAEQGDEEPNDAHLLQDIYDRNGMDLIVQSDIYLSGFEDGLHYREPIKPTKADSDKRKRAEDKALRYLMSELCCSEYTDAKDEFSDNYLHIAYIMEQYAQQKCYPEKQTDEWNGIGVNPKEVNPYDIRSVKRARQFRRKNK